MPHYHLQPFILIFVDTLEGTWKIPQETCVDNVDLAIELGFNHIDTAQIYGEQCPNRFECSKWCVTFTLL